jgi:hypothetical protein
VHDPLLSPAFIKKHYSLLLGFDQSFCQKKNKNQRPALEEKHKLGAQAFFLNTNFVISVYAGIILKIPAVLDRKLARPYDLNQHFKKAMPVDQS